jgi:micrococcal nuclease
MGGKVSLEQVDPKTVESVPRRGLATKCKVTNIHDGDTITVVFRFCASSQNGFMKINIRMKGLDAPELKSQKLETQAARVCTNELTRKLGQQKFWYVVMSKWDKYGGRVIGEIYDTQDCKGVNVNQWLLDEGLAKPYNGGKKQIWTSEELQKIIKYGAPLKDY